MDKDSSISEVILILNERAKTLEASTARDSAFKKEVREFIKYAEPILAKSKDFQELRGKLLMWLLTFLIGGVLGYFFTFG
jgi:hypothetical protein